jgi:hypothetical protein
MRKVPEMFPGQYAQYLKNLRWLIYHPESDDLFECKDFHIANKALYDNFCEDVSGIEKWEKEFIKRNQNTRLNDDNKGEKQMKLELAILAGAESKKFLADFKKQIDRLEELAGKVGPSDDAEEGDEFEEAAPKKKRAAAKKKAAAADDDFAEDEGEEFEGGDDFEEEAPKKKAAKKKVAKKTGARKKKTSVNAVNDACKSLAATCGDRKVVLGILKKDFGVTSVTELEPTQYDEVIQAMKDEEDQYE